VRDSVGQATGVVREVPAAQPFAADIAQAAQESFVGGMHLAFTVAAGITLLVRAPERWLLLVLGCFVLAYAAWGLFGAARQAPISPRWAAPAGAVGGVFTALYGTGGPIYTLYLGRRIAGKSELRATIAMLIFLAGIARLALFTGTGLYAQPGLLRAALFLLPFALVGYAIGNRLHARASTERVRQAVWIVLIAGGAGLTVRALQAAPP